jgi:hypothetical protein
MVQTARRDLPAAGLRRRGDGIVEGFARQRRGGHGVDSISRRRGVLVRDFLSAAQANVDLCVRPRIDARAVDVAVPGTRQTHESYLKRRACRRQQNKFSHHARAVFFPALCRHRHRRVRARPFDLELAKLFRLFPFAARRGLRISCHVDISHVANAPERHHIAGLFIFGRRHFSRQRRGFAFRNSVAHGKNFIVQGRWPVLFGDRKRLFVAAKNSLSRAQFSVILSCYMARFR